MLKKYTVTRMSSLPPGSLMSSFATVRNITISSKNCVPERTAGSTPPDRQILCSGKVQGVNAWKTSSKMQTIHNTGESVRMCLLGLP